RLGCLANITRQYPILSTTLSKSTPLPARSHAVRDRNPPVDHEILPVEELVRRAEQHRTRHILILPGPIRRRVAPAFLLQAALLIRTARTSRHLAREQTR